MEWLNEPASWQRTGDVLTVNVDSGTDFWRETGYGYIRDSGHVYGEVLGGDLDISVRVRCTLGVQYDQAGVMLRADERTWLKTGVEYFQGRSRLSTVLTLGRSSWMVTDLPEGTDEVALRLSRRGDAVEVRYAIEDGPAELAALVFLPPGREVLAGVMGAAPEGPGFRVTFHDLRITEPDWSAPADDAITWRDNQAGWARDESPAWTTPDWPAPAVAEDDPDWRAPEAAADERDWSAPEAAADEPDWRAPQTAADEPGLPAPGTEDAAGPEPERAPAGQPSRSEADGPGPAGTDPAGSGPATAGNEPPAEEPAGTDPAGPEPAAPQARNRPPWPPAQPPEDWDTPGHQGTKADRDAAADWDLLAAGAQAVPAERWVAQADANVANEWPGPPLRTAVRNGLVASGATLAPAEDRSADDVQTDPGLPMPQAGEQPAPEATAPEPATPDAPGAPDAPEDGTAEAAPAEPEPPARESRRGRSKRAAAELPAEPDAADEWISLLTADPVEE